MSDIVINYEKEHFPIGKPVAHKKDVLDEVYAWRFFLFFFSKLIVKCPLYINFASDIGISFFERQLKRITTN